MAAPWTARLLPRRWFDRYEGSSTSPLERVVLIVLGYLLGGAGYILVNRWVGDGPFHTLGTRLDGAIPLVPVFVFGYTIVYFTPAFLAALIDDRADLYRAFTAFGLNALICFAVFLLFPVEYPRTITLPDSLSARILSLIQSVDRPVNCFPSHHISTSFTAFFASSRLSRTGGALFGASALLVTISTLFVKQHYLLDIPGGIAVACATYLMCFPPRRPA